MIGIETKQHLILCYIALLIIILIVVGILCCEHKDKRIINKTIETERITEEDKRTIETETDKEVDTNQVIKPVSLGEFKLTAYCSCEICCNEWALNRPIDENGNEIVYGAIGERLQEGYSIAVDPSVIPYRTEVVINGHTYKAQDCGGAIKGNRIDVYFEDHQAALNFGVQYAEVFLVEK